MSRAGGTISMRLALGFLLVLAVFGAALLVTLYNLEKVKNAAERIRIQQEVRRQALEIGQMAEELFRCQREFLQGEGVEWRKVNEFHDLYERMEDSFQSLLARPLDDLERGYLGELGRAAERLRAIFMDRIVVAKVRAEMQMPPADDGGELEEASRHVLGDITRLNENLAFAFEMRTLAAERNAKGAWNVSLAISKGIIPVALLICLLIIYYTHRSVVRPVGALVQGTKALAAGRLGSSIEADGSGEFRELADSFNSMARALAANQRQLIDAEKMASVGRLAAGVAHEVNNPIAVILGYTQILLAELPEDAPEREQLEAMADEARQCKSIVEGLLDLSRPSEPTIGETVNPSDVVGEVFTTLQALGLAEGVRVEHSVIDRPLPLAISRPRLRQLALNIVRNALEVLQGVDAPLLRVDGYVRPRAKIDPDSLKEASEQSESFLILTVADNGPGMPAESIEQVFEPFFTTKADGMGLGLAISYNIARAHGGFIGVDSGVGQGTTFTVGLPVREES